MSLVSEHLDRQGYAFEVIPHPQAHTSIDEARAVGVDADEVLETLALRTAGGCKAFPGTAPGHPLLGPSHHGGRPRPVPAAGGGLLAVGVGRPDRVTGHAALL
jgi:hypothetical protein